VTGPDATSFLQGMVTNDVEVLPVGESCAVAFLTAKGAMVSDGRVLKREHELLIDVGQGQGEPVRAFLEKYLISEDAAIESVEAYAVVSIFGTNARRGELLKKISQNAVVGQLHTPAQWCTDVLVSRASLDEVIKACEHSTRISSETLEVLRVEMGVPLFGVDLNTSSIPLDVNLDHAIAYKKGCYIGQEVIARATYRGQMNKKLVGFVLDAMATTSSAGSEVIAGDKKVGVLTSVVQSPRRNALVALGFVHRDFVETPNELTLSSGGTARVVALPF
jgi:folate-binding protein YgfZ